MPSSNKADPKSPKGLEGSIWACHEDKPNVCASLTDSITAGQSDLYHIQGDHRAQSVFPSTQSVTLASEVTAPKAQDTVPGSQFQGPGSHGDIHSPKVGGRTCKFGIRDSDSGGGIDVASIHKFESSLCDSGSGSGSGGGDLDATCNSQPGVYNFYFRTRNSFSGIPNFHSRTRNLSSSTPNFHSRTRNSSSGIPDFHFDTRPSPSNTSSPINNPNFQVCSSFLNHCCFHFHWYLSE